MEKEQWFVRTSATRGQAGGVGRMRFYLWKWFGRIVFKHILDPFNALRVGWLRCFGARVGQGCYVSRHAVIVLPWLLELGDSCGLDDYAYVNGRLVAGSHVSIASYAKLVSTGHDVRSRSFDWYCRGIRLGDGVFVGVNAAVFAGGGNNELIISRMSCVGMNSFVIADVAENTIVVGNPARVAGQRLSDEELAHYRFD